MQSSIVRTATASAALLSTASTAVADSTTIDPVALDAAFEALKTFDWGTDRKLLGAIDGALPATRNDPAARKALETRLAAVLPTGAPRAAKDVVFRKLTLLGTAASVPALAAFLADAEWSHMARYALERIPAPEAAQALRDALPKVSGKLKVGMIGSLGVRRDAASVPALAALVGHADATIASAAATALSDIATVEAGQALAKPVATTPLTLRPVVADAMLACAERLLAQNNLAAAKEAYQALLTANPSKATRLAATRGLLIVRGKIG